MTERDVVQTIVRALYHEVEVVVVDPQERAFILRVTTEGKKEEFMVGVQRVKT